MHTRKNMTSFIKMVGVCQLVMVEDTLVKNGDIMDMPTTKKIEMECIDV